MDPESARERQAPVLRVKCWQSNWRPIRVALAREGIELQPGMVVLMRGSLDFYRPKAEIGFILAEIDVTALLGRLAAQRAALLRKLEAEGLLGRNRQLRVPEPPLRVGLVASPGTEGYRDFLGQLGASGFAFSVRVAAATVQGRGAPGAVSSAIKRLSLLGPDELDLIVVVRGGGSKADLAAFDTEPVARAVALSSVPVWTGVGHTGDQSVADAAANRCCVTPTDCGRELAQRVASWWEHSVATAVDLVTRRSAAALDEVERDHAGARQRLGAMARHLVASQSEHLSRRNVAIGRCASRALEDAGSHVVARSARLAPLASAHVHRADDRLAAWRRLIGAYDVERQLERGYTLTFDASGRLVRHASALAPGAELVTRFADGTARSVVSGEETDRSIPGDGAGSRTGPAVRRA